jgi:hypothetical protein
VCRNLTLAVVLAAAAGGCTGDGKQPLAPLTGTVTYKGKPVVGASMTFIPDDTAMRPAIALTDASGRYVMETYEPRDGAAVGSGRLAISLRGPSKKIKPGMGDAALEQLAEAGDPLVPLRYFDPDKSGLRFDVKAKTGNRYDIELTD